MICEWPVFSSTSHWLLSVHLEVIRADQVVAAEDKIVRLSLVHINHVHRALNQDRNSHDQAIHSHGLVEAMAHISVKIMAYVLGTTVVHVHPVENHGSDQKIVDQTVQTTAVHEEETSTNLATGSVIADVVGVDITVAKIGVFVTVAEEAVSSLLYPFITWWQAGHQS